MDNERLEIEDDSEYGYEEKQDMPNLINNLFADDGLSRSKNVKQAKPALKT
jgi:hypothetical protein